MPAYRLYWLRCLTEGKEEQPFLIDAEGKQRFVYGDVIDNIKAIDALDEQRTEVFHHELMRLLRCLVLFQTAEQAYV